jgi:hypothetical protein
MNSQELFEQEMSEWYYYGECLKMIKMYNLNLKPEQVYMIWKRYSSKHHTHW